MDPITIGTAFASALGALSNAKWQASTSQSLAEIEGQLVIIEEQMTQLLDLVKDLYSFVLHTDEDTVRKYITGTIDAQRASFGDRVSNLRNARHPSTDEMAAFEKFGIEVAETGYTIFVWGGISYPSVAQAAVTSFACFKIAQSKPALVESVKTHFLDWLKGRATGDFNNASSSFDSIFQSKKLSVDEYPKQTWLGQEEDVDAGSPDNNNPDYSYTDWYCDLTGYGFETGFPAATSKIVTSDAPPRGHNPRGWPLAPGFDQSFQSGGDAIALVNQRIISPLNGVVTAGEDAEKQRDNAKANVAAIQAIVNTIEGYHQ